MFVKESLRRIVNFFKERTSAANLKSLQNKIFGRISRYFWLWLTLILVIKIVFLPFTSHPYDFATFVFQIRQYFDFGVTPLNYWNKGIEAIALWLPAQGFYLSVLDFFNLAKDQVMLLQFLYKLPLLFFDILGCFFIYKLVLSVIKDKIAAKVSFLLVFSSSLVFYVATLHGHYEVLVFASVAMLLWGLCEKRMWAVVLGLVLGISTKYFLVLLAPLICLYLWKQGWKIKKQLILWGLVFAGLIISFFPFLVDKNLFGQLVSSLVWHSEPVAPFYEDFIKIFPLSLLAFPLFLILGHIPNNVNDPEIFQIIGKSVYLFLIAYVLYLAFLIPQILRKKEYPFINWVAHSFIILLIFTFFYQKIQFHYLIWFVPFFSVLIFFSRKIFVLYFAFASLAWILLLKGEIGTFTYFINVLNGKDVLGFHNIDKVLGTYLPSFVLMIVLLATCIVLFKFEKFKATEKIKQPLTFGFLFVNYIFLVFLTVSLIGAVFTLVQNRQTLPPNYFASMDNIIPGMFAYSKYGAREDKIVDYHKMSPMIRNLLAVGEQEKKYFQVELVFLKDLNLPDYSYKLNNCSDYKIDEIQKKIYFDISCLVKDENILIINAPTREKLMELQLTPRRLLVSIIKDAEGNFIDQRYLFLDNKRKEVYILAFVELLAITSLVCLIVLMTRNLKISCED